METSSLFTNSAPKENQKLPDIVISDLPKERGWLTEYIHPYKGFWYGTPVLQGLIALQDNHFKLKPNDVLLASYPKSGTTWLKALLFAIINRAQYDFNTHPLLSSNPHELVPHLETYAFKYPTNPIPNSSLMHTHLAFNCLPESIVSTDDSSKRKIVYVFRDPKDVLASYWYFVQKVRPKDLPFISLPDAFDQFSKGYSPFGPFWDHVMGYYKASIEFPKIIFFLKYEDLKKDPKFHIKRLAEFLEKPFSLEEESEGTVEKIIELCSFEKLSNLEVNKEGTHNDLLFSTIANNVYFRQGKVGDSKNHLSEEMIEVLDEITNQKLSLI